MQRRSQLARAGLGLAALAFALALARGKPAAPDCPAPGELAAAGGHSVVLSCLAQTRGRPLRGPARLLVGLPIDPNQADAATLEVLPGIGPGRALAIVTERERGRFRSVAELTRVPGIGPRTLAGLIGWVSVGEAPGPRELGPPRPNPVGCAAECEAPRREGDS
jgi:hypothetical protein